MELTADIIYLLEVAFLVLTIAVSGRTKEPYIFLQRSLCFKSKHVSVANLMHRRQIC